MSAGSRIVLFDIADKIAAEFGVTKMDEAAAIYVSTCYDPKYLALFTTKWPAVWVAAQKMTPRDAGRGFSGIARQHCDVQIMVRPVVQRYLEDPASGSDAETRLADIYDKVDDALYGWKPPGASIHFTWSSAVDGAAYESICTVDMIYLTQTAYSVVAT